jgi:YVTN family beta-propeller protein
VRRWKSAAGTSRGSTARCACARATKAPYYVYVTNEIGGDLTVIDGGTNQVVTTIPLGKRPRGSR